MTMSTQGFPLNVRDVSDLVLPFVSPTLWARLPEHHQGNYECDIDGYRRVLSPIVLGGTITHGDYREPATLRDIVSSDVEKIGRMMNEVLERRLVRARLGPFTAVPLAVIDGLKRRTMVMVLVFSEFTNVALNEKLGIPVFTPLDEISNSWTQDNG